ncbi:MAG: RHS repeat protein [Acidobacteria bacterium]|nr:RHS repeat protein [Acidobacteriota bacterium]
MKKAPRVADLPVSSRRFFLIATLLAIVLLGGTAEAGSRAISSYPLNDPWWLWLRRVVRSAMLEMHPGNAPPEATDPVVTSVGEYTHTTLDLYLGGPLPLGFGRHFGSFIGSGAQSSGFYGQFDGPPGANWVHNFFILLRRIDASTVGVYYYEGKEIYFRKSGALWIMAQTGTLYRGTPYQLIESGTKLRFMDPETRMIYAFETSGLRDGGVRGVETIQDRNGNTHALSYNPDGTLSRVTDGLGRSLEFAYIVSGSRGRISKVTDQTGRFLEFSYNGAQLRSRTNARGKVTTYGSDAVGRIESITLARGNTPVRNVYSADKIVSQSDGAGNLTRFSYGSGTTTITDPLGNAVVHQFDAGLRMIGLADPAGKAIRYDYDASQRRTSTVDRMGDRSLVSYDPASGKVTARTDNDGKTWRYSYAAQAQEGFTFYNLIRVEYPDASRDEFEYDARGNVVAWTDRAAKRWTYSYNSRGQILTDTNRAGATTRRTYNDDGTLASIQDPAGNTTTFGYDALKRVNRTNRPDGNSVQYSYDANDNLLATTNEKGKTASYSYDDNNNLKSITDPLGNTWTFTYDANDNVTAATDPAGRSATYTYDALERIKTFTDRNGNATTYNHDARGRLTSAVDAEGKTWALSYDDEGVLASFTNPLGRTWRLSSDKLGRTRTLTDPLSSQSRYDYDGLSRLISRINPLNETTAYAYDPRGLLSQISLPEQISAAYSRSDLGRITRITDARGKARNWAFDNLGRLTSATDPLGNIARFSYDARNRVKQIELPASTLDLAYDGVSLVTGRNYSDGIRLDYTYDDANRLVSATGVTLAYDNANRILSTNGITLSRDDGGRISTMTLSPGKTVTYAYDKRNLLTSVADWAGGAIRFTYDDAGRLATISRPNGVATTYNYDTADRLTGIAESKGPTSLSLITLTRDGAGQIKEAARSAPLDPAPVQGNRNQSYNDADQIVGYSYDAMGRLGTGGGRSYRWDLASRLASYTEGQSTVSFTYDAFGNRLARAQAETTQSYVWNYALGLPSISIVREGDTTLRYYIHTPAGSLLHSIEESGNARRFYHYDEMGSTLFLTDDSGQISDSYAYSASGQLTAATGTSDNPFTYIGRFGVLREPATGLYYMRARWYDSVTGRFLSRDPQGISLVDPRTLNPYEYASQNPLRYVDPLGLGWFSSLFKRLTLSLRIQLGYVRSKDVGEIISKLGTVYPPDPRLEMPLMEPEPLRQSFFDIDAGLFPPSPPDPPSQRGRVLLESDVGPVLPLYYPESQSFCLEGSCVEIPPADSTCGATGGGGSECVTGGYYGGFDIFGNFNPRSEGPPCPQPPPAESPAPDCGGAPEGTCGPGPSCGVPGCQFDALPFSARETARKERPDQIGSAAPITVKTYINPLGKPFPPIQDTSAFATCP